MKSQKNQRAKQRQQRKKLTSTFFVLGGALLVALAVWALVGKGTTPKAAIEVTGSPSLKADQEKIDLGNVSLGKTVNVSFRLTNVGDQPLRFKEQPYIEVVEGCWPPTPTIGSMVLKSGESTSVGMQFMMHGDMGGMHNFRVHLLTNDPKQPDHTLTVLSNWVP